MTKNEKNNQYRKKSGLCFSHLWGSRVTCTFSCAVHAPMQVPTSNIINPLRRIILTHGESFIKFWLHLNVLLRKNKVWQTTDKQLPNVDIRIINFHGSVATSSCTSWIKIRPSYNVLIRGYRTRNGHQPHKTEESTFKGWFSN